MINIKLTTAIDIRSAERILSTIKVEFTNTFVQTEYSFGHHYSSSSHENTVNTLLTVLSTKWNTCPKFKIFNIEIVRQNNTIVFYYSELGNMELSIGYIRIKFSTDVSTETFVNFMKCFNQIVEYVFPICGSYPPHSYLQKDYEGKVLSKNIQFIFEIQSSTKDEQYYLQIKLVKAYFRQADENDSRGIHPVGAEGMNLTYVGGDQSWCPMDEFKKYNLPISKNQTNTIKHALAVRDSIGEDTENLHWSHARTRALESILNGYVETIQSLIETVRKGLSLYD